MYLLGDCCEIVLWSLAYVIMPRLETETTLSPGTITLAVIANVMFLVTYLSFDTATWYFCYHYYHCQAKLRYVKDRKPVPPTFECRHKALLWGLMALNVIVPISYTLANSVTTLHQARDPSDLQYPWLLTTNIFMQGFVQFLSYMFLAFGLYKIRKFL